MAKNGPSNPIEPGARCGPYRRAGDPWRGLAASVLIQAVRDCQQREDQILALDAAAWLLHEAQFWLDGLGVDYDPDTLAGWVKAGCPDGRKKPTSGPESNGKQATRTK